jgi:hypothetical protein
MVMRLRYVLFAFIIVIMAAASALAVPTQITVRVKSKDAKFVGTSMGGALITIRNVHTGELLAKGYTSGGTGNTARIMKTPVTRGMPLSDESAAAFATSIDIDEPTLIEVSAYGPTAGLQSANRVSATQWVVPGKHITGGDGFLMELPGFVVNVESPSSHSTLTGTPKAVTLRANVTMMCGCPITPDGLWDANKIEVAALLSKNGQRAGVLPLQYTGTPNQFTGTWTIQEAGTYDAVVYAFDASNGNTGIDRVTFVVGP